MARHRPSLRRIPRPRPAGRRQLAGAAVGIVAVVAILALVPAAFRRRGPRDPLAPPPAPAIHGWAVVDDLDVGDPASERAHGWRAEPAPRAERPRPAGLDDTAAGGRVTDGGRFLTGAESFTVAAVPGRPVVLLARLYAPFGGGVAVSWDGEAPSGIPVGASPGRFQTILLAQAAADRVRGRNRVELAPWRGDARGRAPAHYWTLQPVTSGSSTGTR